MMPTPKDLREWQESGDDLREINAAIRHLVRIPKEHEDTMHMVIGHYVRNRRMMRLFKRLRGRKWVRR